MLVAWCYRNQDQLGWYGLQLHADLTLLFPVTKKKCTKKTICLVVYLLAPNRPFCCVCSVAWPLSDNKARGDFVLIKITTSVV